MAATASSTPNKLRNVGLMEQYFTHRHHLNYYTCVVTSAFYTRRHLSSNAPSPTDQQPQPLIYAALHNLIPQHPMLSVTIVGEDTSKPYYSALTKIDLDKMVHIHPSGGDMDEIVQDELCRNFKQQMQAGGPCWRVVVMPGIVDNISGFWVVLVFHHIIADGLGGFVFHKDLLRSLNSRDLDLENPISSIVEVPNPGQLTPAMEHMHKFRSRLGYLLKAIRDEYLPFASPSTPNLWVCGDSGKSSYFPPPPAGLRTELLTLRIPPEVMKGVIMKTREEKTRITPLLEVLLSLAFLEVFPRSNNIRVSVIVSVRRWLEKQLQPYGGADNVLGLYVTQFTEVFTRAVFDFSKPLPSIYSEAKRAGETIDKILLSSGRNTAAGLLRFIRSFDSYFKSKAGHQRKDSVEISNVGVFKTGAVPTRDEWGIDDVRFSQSASVTGAAVECSTVSLESGAMALGFTWQEGIVTKEEMGRVLERMRALLELVGAEE